MISFSEAAEVHRERSGAMIKRFLGLSPWKRMVLGCQAYAGVNLATRKRYFKGLSNLRPFARASNTTGTHQSLHPAGAGNS